MRVEANFINGHKGVTDNVLYIEGLGDFDSEMSYINMVVDNFGVKDSECIPKQDLKSIKIVF